MLAAIAAKRGAMLSGGRVNLQKAAEVLVYEFRQSLLGRISLETPEEFLGWQAAAELAEATRKSSKGSKKKSKPAPAPDPA